MNRLPQGASSFHEGIDLGCPNGTEVRSARGGFVDFAGWRSGYGNLVIVGHLDSRKTRYGHLSSISVSQGQLVGQGTVLGNVGATGNVTGPHLHFEIRDPNDNATDPEHYRDF